MKVNPVAFVASRFFIGRQNSAGTNDQARKALRGAILSIAISLVPLLTVMQVADGMIEGITARYVELGTYHAELYPYASTEYKEARNLAKKAPGIKGAYIETQSVAVVFANGMKEGVQVRGVEQEFLSDSSTLDYLEILSGEVKLNNKYDCLVGSSIASKLSLKTGDKINIINFKQKDDGNLLPRVSIFTIKGIVSAGYRELDSQWLFLRQDTVAAIFPEENTKTFIGVKGTNPFKDPDGAKNQLANYTLAGFIAFSWNEIERNLFQSLASTRTMLLLIMTITVAVAAVNVSSALMTLVLERREEIAILKSQGASRFDLARIFTFGGAVIGGLGSLLGAAGGLLVSLNINNILSFIEQIGNIAQRVLSYFKGNTINEAYHVLDPEYYLQVIPVNVSFSEIAVVIIFTVGLSFIASLWPAVRAAKMSPLEAFRKR